jgi:hypothetical protein
MRIDGRLGCVLCSCDVCAHRSRSFTFEQFGNVNEQVDFVAEQLRNVTELSDGFDAVGFSQGTSDAPPSFIYAKSPRSCSSSCSCSSCFSGGQFLRAYVERYNSPPVHNLVTFGSQHMGVSDIQPCKPVDVTCQLARRALRNGVYSSWAQSNIVPVRSHLLLPLPLPLLIIMLTFAHWPTCVPPHRRHRPSTIATQTSFRSSSRETASLPTSTMSGPTATR